MKFLERFWWQMDSVFNSIFYSMQKRIGNENNFEHSGTIRKTWSASQSHMPLPATLIFIED
ncbi:hypothetical protein T4B_5675 [Trichinella pseudospiralis]|uniref:Uncharacterized protein n=2 Tax=Trichinella pseudospiralis TaxID=6337 RepID=A0A0V1GTU8_TRIPS|nr:hypothetical protein T4A_4670 [Trichinella pseudospiralis]KRY70425.1 hypothetical protein T4A_4037 [Trichinella pseudospiralis]KRY81054.1 hypothetical protein T4D_1245 [Trichinella pseudospiralis]KRY92194.1 hypothetical protein T4D_5494 [Trichinella pseudospiralis]KRZ01798.1 hypothetical protein T4B_8902 [Trichinella pseudospiralis]